MMDVNEKKRGLFAEPDQLAKRQCVVNPEYQNAFQMFDQDRSGTIDILELNNALQAVERSVEGSTSRAMFPHPFQANTVLWLAGKFAAKGGGVIAFPQFAEMMQYLESLKHIFEQIDVDRTGDLSVAELSRALKLSGFNVTGFSNDGGDPLSLMVAEKIGRAYDADGNGVLTFDEFVQMRLEWDVYLDAWSSSVPPGANAIQPQQLIQLLSAIKDSLEPFGALAQSPQMASFPGFNPGYMLSGLLYNSMFQTHRPFSLRTAELMILKHGNGSSAVLSFEQFCMLMEWCKENKKKFVAADTAKNGVIDINELSTAFAVSGLPMPLPALIEIGRRYDQDGSGSLEFDEFLQMMAELKTD